MIAECENDLQSPHHPPVITVPTQCPCPHCLHSINLSIISDPRPPTSDQRQIYWLITTISHISHIRGMSAIIRTDGLKRTDKWTNRLLLSMICLRSASSYCWCLLGSWALSPLLLFNSSADLNINGQTPTPLTFFSLPQRHILCLNRSIDLLNSVQENCCSFVME